MCAEGTASTHNVSDQVRRVRAQTCRQQVGAISVKYMCQLVIVILLKLFYSTVIDLTVMPYQCLSKITVLVSIQLLRTQVQFLHEFDAPKLCCLRE